MGHLAHVPRFDPSNNWRFRYHGMFLALVVIVWVSDIAFAMFVYFYPFGTPTYLYGAVMAVSIIEALVIGVDVALIEFHIGTRTHLDLGKGLMPLWFASLSINIAYCIGSRSGATGDNASVYKVGLFIVGVSQLSGLCLFITSILLHILLLTDADPAAHGFHAKGIAHDHGHHGSRRHKGEEEDDEKGLSSGGDDEKRLLSGEDEDGRDEGTHEDEEKGYKKRRRR